MTEKQIKTIKKELNLRDEDKNYTYRFLAEGKLPKLLLDDLNLKQFCLFYKTLLIDAIESTFKNIQKRYLL